MGMGPAFSTAPAELTGDVPKHVLRDTVVAFFPSLDMYDSASEHDVYETFRRARGLLLPFYCSNRPRSPALWPVDANFGDRLHFGGFAQTGRSKARKMGDKHDSSMRARSQGSPWRPMLKRWKPIRISLILGKQNEPGKGWK
jgi:hypothetical protein